MPAEYVYLYCPSCARECLTEAPPCGDGHDELCPDRACVECGAALLAPPLLMSPSATRAHRHAA